MSSGLPPLAAEPSGQAAAFVMPIFKNVLQEQLQNLHTALLAAHAEALKALPQQHWAPSEATTPESPPSPTSQPAILPLITETPPSEVPESRRNSEMRPVNSGMQQTSSGMQPSNSGMFPCPSGENILDLGPKEAGASRQDFQAVLDHNGGPGVPSSDQKQLSPKNGEFENSRSASAVGTGIIRSSLKTDGQEPSKSSSGRLFAQGAPPRKKQFSISEEGVDRRISFSEDGKEGKDRVPQRMLVRINTPPRFRGQSMQRNSWTMGSQETKPIRPASGPQAEPQPGPPKRLSTASNLAIPVPEVKTSVSISPSESPSVMMNFTSENVDSQVSDDENIAFEEYPVWTRLSNQRKSSFESSKSMRSRHTTAFDEDEIEIEGGEVAPVGRFNKMLKFLVMEPNTPKRLGWDMFGFLMLSYDIICIPMQVFNPPETSLTLRMMWVTRIFWTLDLVLSFWTKQVTESGQAVKTFTQIAWGYMRSWFLLDLALVVYDWLEVAATLRIMRTLRVIRLIRLYRLLKMDPQAMTTLFHRSNSEVFPVVLSLFRMMLVVLVVCHFTGCTWYGVSGKAPPGEENWVTVIELDERPISHRYVAALHWAVTQSIGSSFITPQNHLERSVAVLVLLMSFVLTAAAVGSITTAMTRLQFLASQKTQQLMMLNMYISHHGISRGLAARVHSSVQHAIALQKRHTPEHQVELLQLLSEPLRIELHYEVYSPVFNLHPFLRAYTRSLPAAMRQVCHQAVSHTVLARSDVLFSEGEVPAAPRMYFVRGGSLLYMREDVLTETVKEGQWVGEHCLWLPWSFCGVMKAATDCVLLGLHAKEFQDILYKFRTAEYCPGRYAVQYVSCLNCLDEKQLTDMHDGSINIDKIVQDLGPVEDDTQKKKMPSLWRQFTRTSGFSHHSGGSSEVHVLDSVSFQPGFTRSSLNRTSTNSSASTSFFGHKSFAGRFSSGGGGKVLPRVQSGVQAESLAHSSSQLSAESGRSSMAFSNSSFTPQSSMGRPLDESPAAKAQAGSPSLQVKSSGSQLSARSWSGWSHAGPSLSAQPRSSGQADDPHSSSSSRSFGKFMRQLSRPRFSKA